MRVIDIKRVYKLYVLGISQSEIAQKLGVSQGKVSKIVTSARRDGLLIDQPMIAPGVISKAEEEEIARLTFANWPTLEKVLKPSLRAGARGKLTSPSIHVIDTGSRKDDPESYDRRLGILAHVAAERVAELILPRAKLIGVSWGKMISCLTNSMKQLSHLSKSSHKVRFVPVAGEPLSNDNSKLPASGHARELQRAFTGRDDAPNLAASAAYIPHHFDDSEVATIHKYLSCIEGYRQIFGKDGGRRSGQPLIEMLDGMITSVGSADPVVPDHWNVEAAEAAKISQTKLASITLGNISGYFLPRPGLSSGDAAEVARINVRWIGVTKDHMVQCARRAREPGQSPGMIVLAVGRTKAEVVRSCSQMGIINHLFIDDELADALIEVEKDNRPRR